MVTPVEELLTFKKFQAGDKTAFKNFLQLNFRTWVNYAKDLLENKLHSEEVVLEAFSKIWQAKKNCAGFNNAKAFVILSIDRACRDYLSRIAEEKRSVIRIPGNKKPAKYHRYNSRKNRKWLKANEQFVTVLPNQERQVFILHYFVQDDAIKISYLLGTSETYVRSLLKKANLKLRMLRMKNK